MPDPHFDLPGDFPDLTLPEKTSNAPEPVDPLAQIPISRPPRWKVGERVLAPWEPDCVYVGRIIEINDRRALIQFEDGDAGWVNVDRIRPVMLQRGQKVFSRRKMGPHFHRAEIVEIRGDQVLVGFVDTRDQEWTTVAALRIPCEVGPGAEPTTVASHTAFHKTLEPGDRVWAPWQHGTLFAGTVDQIKGREVHIHFDDGDRGWVLLDQITPLLIPVGLFVLGRRKMGSRYYPGRVTAVDGDQVDIRYDDGKKESTTAAALAVPCETFGPDARPTGAAHFGRSQLGWLIPLAVFLLLTLTRVGCR